MDRICTQYGLGEREPDTWVERPPREPDTRVTRPPRGTKRPRARGDRRFVITIPHDLAEDFGVPPSQVPADHYAIDCCRRPLERR